MPPARPVPAGWVPLGRPRLEPRDRSGVRRAGNGVPSAFLCWYAAQAIAVPVGGASIRNEADPDPVGSAGRARRTRSARPGGGSNVDPSPFRSVPLARHRDGAEPVSPPASDPELSSTRIVCSTAVQRPAVYAFPPVETTARRGKMYNFPPAAAAGASPEANPPGVMPPPPSPPSPIGVALPRLGWRTIAVRLCVRDRYNGRDVYRPAPGV